MKEEEKERLGNEGTGIRLREKQKIEKEIKEKEICGLGVGVLELILGIYEI